ncbi:MAG: hypothetical protein IPH13_18275 [Planctomycetes bacterium]|nr:hypothetical protein [Planctomycetota bacterium]
MRRFGFELLTIGLGLVAAAAGLVPLTAPAFATSVRADDWKRVAPFSGLRVDGDVVEIRVDGDWVRWIAIDGIEVTTIVAHAKRTFRDRWTKRIGEDLVEVLAGLDHELGDECTLRVADLDGGNERDLADTTVTSDKRRDVLVANRKAFEDPVEPPRAARLSSAQVERDVDVFFAALEERFAYAGHGDVDLDALRAETLGELRALGECDATRLGLTLTRVLARFVDGHARVDPDPLEASTTQFLPFLTEFAAGKLVAFEADRSALLDAERPYVVALDGVPIERWIAAADAYIARGAPAYRGHRATRVLRCLGLLRADLGIAAADAVVVTLGDASGKDTTTIARRVASSPPRFGTWPRNTTHTRDDGIAIVRIESMDDEPEFLDRIEREIERAKDAEGLILDVRGNGGGSRALLVRLAPHFLDPKAPPVIANIAAKRLFDGDDADAREGLLANRFLFPAGSSEFDAGTKAFLAQHMKTFRPQWTLPQGAFSAWHFLVLRPDAKAWRVGCPVVVLQDGGCFSATDIFLGAFEQFPNVTLVGTASGGGSGRVQPVELPASGSTVMLSSMASFRADGRMYDGRGVAPVVEVTVLPTDFIGATDAAVEVAARMLLNR